MFTLVYIQNSPHFRCPTLYFTRQIDLVLSEWAADRPRKPLVLRGARQTGKTAAVRRLGEQFHTLVELNFERHADRSLASACRSADELVEALRVRHDVARFPESTLLFLDEIQEYPPAVGWLRFLYEDHADLAVVAAGSLLEMRLAERGFSFPVGRVTFREVGPFGLDEFMRATERSVLSDAVGASVQRLEPLAPPLHEAAVAAMREWLVVGGMPEAVAGWVRDRSVSAVRRVHGDLIQAFSEDIQKYRGVRDLAYIEAAFAAQSVHWGLRYKYENFAPGFRSALMKAAIDKLEAARIVRRVLPTTATTRPLVPKARAAAKLLPLDVGIALTVLGVPNTEIQQAPLEGLLAGRVAEIAAGQLLNASRFWVREDAGGTAEVDYLVEAGGHVMPVEVKAGATGRLRSLHQYLSRAETQAGVRLHGGPLSDERHKVALPGGPLDYRLVSVPLYAAEWVAGLIEGWA